MGNVAGGWRGWAAFGLALAGQAALADQVFFNHSSLPVSMRVVEVKVSKAVLRVQVHRTGKTPKTATPTVVLDEYKGERKTFVPDQAGALAPLELVVTPVRRRSPSRPSAFHRWVRRASSGCRWPCRPTTPTWWSSRCPRSATAGACRCCGT